MQERWYQRTRPLPEAVAWVQTRFSAVLVVDGSTLDGLLRKVGLLRDEKPSVLAGPIAAVLDVVTRFPTRIWYDADAQGSDQQFWPHLVSHVVSNFLNYTMFDPLHWTLFRDPSQVQYRHSGAKCPPAHGECS